MPASSRVLALLKQISAEASESATVDQAADHSGQNKLQRSDFELNVTEEPPTGDQLKTIIEYAGERKASQVVDGARDALDAMHKLSQDKNKFRAPVVSTDMENATSESTDKTTGCGLE